MSQRLHTALLLRALLAEFGEGYSRWAFGLARFEPLARLGNPHYVMPEELR